MVRHPPSDDPAAAVLDHLRRAGWHLGVAESLTGGLLADRFVRVPGASEVFRAALVTYATGLKGELLGVDADLLATYGPVHPEVAAQMATGAASVLGADLALATTGAAGPAGQDGQHVGTIYLACAHPGGVWVRRYRLAGTRALVRTAAVDLALALGLSVATEVAGPTSDAVNAAPREQSGCRNALT